MAGRSCAGLPSLEEGPGRNGPDRGRRCGCSARAPPRRSEGEGRGRGRMPRDDASTAMQARPALRRRLGQSSPRTPRRCSGRGRSLVVGFRAGQCGPPGAVRPAQHGDATGARPGVGLSAARCRALSGTAAMYCHKREPQRRRRLGHQSVSRAWAWKCSGICRIVRSIVKAVSPKRRRPTSSSTTSM